MRRVPLAILMLALGLVGCAGPAGEARPGRPSPAGTADKYKANTTDVDVMNRFVRAYPGYKARAGAFYEVEYLDKAAAQLTAAAKLSPAQSACARQILRAFLYDWLDSFVTASGRMRPDHHTQLLVLLDERFHGELNDEQYAEYLAWRKDETGGGNALAFLMVPRLALAAPADEPEDALPGADRSLAAMRATQYTIAIVGEIAEEPSVVLMPRRRTTYVLDVTRVVAGSLPFGTQTIGAVQLGAGRALPKGEPVLLLVKPLDSGTYLLGKALPDTLVNRRAVREALTGPTPPATAPAQ